LVETKMEEFKKTNQTQDLSDEGITLYGNSQRAEDQKSQLLLENRYLAEMGQIINSDNFDEMIIPSSIGIDDPNFNNLMGELSQTQLDLKFIQSDKGTLNPMVAVKRKHLEGLKAVVLENIRTLTFQHNIAIEQMNSTIGRMRASMKNLPTAERELISIQRNYDLNEKLYLLLIEKKAEAGIAKASNTIDFRVVNRAEISGPIKPNKKLNYLTALLLGIGFPLGFLYLKEIFNNKITSKEQLLRIARFPFLGNIASGKSVNSVSYYGKGISAVSESFRTVRSNLRYLMNGEQGGKTFLVTSSISGEGKSFCSKNLAMVFSNFGKRVCLINGDMRKYANDYDEFEIDHNIGLSDYLAGIAGTEEVIQQTNLKNLSVITSGGLPPNPSELLISGRLEHLLDDLKVMFDYVIMDSAPIGILADAIELMHKVNVTVFVVRQNYTLKKQVIEATAAYGRNRQNNLSLLLNDVNFKRLKYGYSYYNANSKKPKKQLSKVT